MTQDRPKWPDSLPPPTEIFEGKRQVNLRANDLEAESGIINLVHDIYWYPDDEYFFYSVYGEGIAKDLHSKLEAAGIIMKKTEMYFYRHPKPAYLNDFVRALPHMDLPQRIRDAAKGQMYARTELALAPAYRKNLDFQEIARVTTKVLAENDPVLELKPNFVGFGVNLHSLASKLKKWWHS